ncbi:SRPBCC family protein [Methylocapsa palsarum]|uniref:Uncharacterized conserved protein YndB, AHSA1/START domain n=1 Tax=Methylocapsa palsarum TaxID=1612308 RepID=A0A1I4CN05_9HYPH|nr:SRPBCC domain-containing protein [Methylocapsa palsarum]SFK82654.1 Uncharacterized conserved protein YndB, AHSA1/START domain [Methylocapsa palsarum]
MASDSELAGRVLEITRIFDAPRALVFEMWTDPAHLRHWMGPRDHPAVELGGDFRPGGRWRTCLRPENGGRDLWQGGVYREIVKPERLVFTFAWDQDDGRPGPETEVTVLFEDHEGDRTRMTFRQAVFNTSANRDGHRFGWSSSFDRLDEYLRTI